MRAGPTAVDDVEAAGPGHLDVEKDQIRLAGVRWRRSLRCRSGHSATSSSQSSRARSVRSRSRASGSSSATRTRTLPFVMRLGMPPRLAAARVPGGTGISSLTARPLAVVRELNAMRRTVEALEPIARVREANAAAQARARAGAQPNPVVADFDPEIVALPARRNLHEPRPRLRRHAMLDRVLDERLQNQARHFGVERVGIDVEPNRQSILETRLFDLQVLLQELQLLLQRDAEPRRSDRTSVAAGRSGG